MKAKPILTALILLGQSALFAQLTPALPGPELLVNQLSASRPEQSAVSNAATIQEALDSTFDAITGISPAIGFNAAMLLPDGTVWKRARGLSEELPVEQPLTTEHLMGMGSISKSFVSVALLLLSEDTTYNLDLGDSIGKYLDPYPNIDRSATIRQLLSHRTGFNDYLNENPAMAQEWIFNPDSLWEADTVLTYYVLAPNFPVDSAWSYSNTNYLLAGRILEKVTGKPWHVVVREQVLDPLGLTHTFVFPWETPGTQPFSHVWIDFDGNGTVEDLQGLDFPMEGLFSLAGSAGCLISTPEDLVRFSERVYGGHVLQPATLAEMQTDYTLDPGASTLYGLGALSINIPGFPANWGHDGNLIYKSIAEYFPDQEMALAVQQNDDRVAFPGIPDISYIQVYLSLLETFLTFTPTSVHAPGVIEGNFEVFPNPVRDVVQVRFDDVVDVSLNLTDVHGRVVISQNLYGQQTELQVDGLPEGAYFLTVSGTAGMLPPLVRRVVVVR